MLYHDVDPFSPFSPVLIPHNLSCLLSLRSEGRKSNIKDRRRLTKNYTRVTATYCPPQSCLDYSQFEGQLSSWPACSIAVQWTVVTQWKEQDGTSLLL